MVKAAVTFKRIYILSDILAAIMVWSLFFIYRKVYVEPLVLGHEVSLHLGLKFQISIILIVLYWLVIYYFTGYYKEVLRKTRLEDFVNTLIHSLIGVFLLFLLVILDDTISSYKTYYQSLMVLVGLQIFIVLTFRLIVTSCLIHQKFGGKIKFPSVFIGKPELITPLWQELNEKYKGHGLDFKGYVPITESGAVYLPGLANLGLTKDVKEILKQHNIEDVIIVLNENNHDLLQEIMESLNTSKVSVKVNPELYPMVKGYVNVTSLFQYPLIQINQDVMSPWQMGVKKMMDISLSVLGLVLSLPISILLVIGIKLSSKGPVLYSHERVGQYGNPFQLFKFRSMYIDAELNGPQLATKDDPRITPIGKFMRRLRLDEIPNLINVLSGDMSVVGPRPERQFYIDQIVQKAPEYNQLLKVKPGVTSWGQVRYGYAESVDEMIRRMKYDLVYIGNMSIYVDIQILARTIITILQGKGV